jgi:hypothetical protein
MTRHASPSPPAAQQKSNMQAKNYLVTQAHVSEYPRPITFSRGAVLAVGEKYAGPEGWDDWFFCEIAGQEGGWVPVQVLEFLDGQAARAREDYTARELDVRAGDMLLGGRTLNGWVWCENPASAQSGWVPLSHLQSADASAEAAQKLNFADRNTSLPRPTSSPPL